MEEIRPPLREGKPPPFEPKIDCAPGGEDQISRDREPHDWNGGSLPGYIPTVTLVASSNPPWLLTDALSDIRQNMREECERDPEFAEEMRRPLYPDDPEHPLLDRYRAGEFRSNEE